MFPKDLQTLIRTETAVGYDAKVLQAVKAVNYRQKEKLFDYIMRHYNNKVKGKTIALWGLSFKPNTDDSRTHGQVMGAGR